MRMNEEFLKRYTSAQAEVIKKYWDTIRWTRRGGKVSDNIINTELDYWSQFDRDVVIKALEIHIKNYPNIKEHYTRGIIRNMAVEKETGKNVSISVPNKPKRDKFINYEQRTWDFEELERLENELNSR